MGSLAEIRATHRLGKERESVSNDSQRILAASRAFAESVVSPPAKEPIKHDGYLNKECLHCSSRRFYPNKYPCKQCIEEASKKGHQ